MTESSPPETAAAPPKVFIPEDVLFALVDAIATQLQEPNRRLLRKIVLVVGIERAQALFAQTVAIEAAGGQLTRDGTRRKTPGGVFITLARAQAVDKAERRRLLDFGPSKKRPVQPPPPDGTPTVPQPTAAGAQLEPAPEARQSAPAPLPASPIPAPTWDEVKQLVKAAIQQIGEVKTVKLTLIGRPGKVVQQASCVVVALKGKEPPSLPKGLPTPPANSAITWAVFIANKQWDKVKTALTQNAEDQLIIEGYPLIDPKSGTGVVLATSCKSVMQERAQREAKKATA